MLSSIHLTRLGLIGFFILYGILQERIMTVPYGDPPGVKFTRYRTFLIGRLSVLFRHSSTYLVLNNRLVGALVALVML